jgi:hypothetical protein
MDWMTTLQPMPELRPMFEPEAGESPAPRNGFHVRRAGLGVFAAVYLRDGQADTRYADFRRWKDDPTGQATTLDSMAGAIVILIREWCPAVPSDWLVTAPPQGASEGQVYAAGVLGREVAARLNLDFQTTLRRTGGAKKWHHPRKSMRQAPYTVAVVPPSVCLIVDDWVSSGSSMRLAREAFAAAGVPSFGMAWGAN